MVVVEQQDIKGGAFFWAETTHYFQRSSKRIEEHTASDTYHPETKRISLTRSAVLVHEVQKIFGRYHSCPLSRLT